MTKFSLGNYIAGLIGGLSTMVLPMLITNIIGAKFSAYFYMDMMIANLLYIIPMATSQSLFAEGSYSEIELKVHFKESNKDNFFTSSPRNSCNLSIWKIYSSSLWKGILKRRNYFSSDISD